MTDQPLSNRGAALCSGAAPTRLTMPNLTGNQTLAAPPAQPQPLNTMSTLDASLPSFIPKTFNPSFIGDPVHMRGIEKKCLKDGPKANILTRLVSEKDRDDAWAIGNKAPFPARMLCAFSRNAKQQLAGLKLGRTGQVFVEGVSPVAIEAMVSYLYAVCSPPQEAAPATTDTSMKAAETSKNDKKATTKGSGKKAKTLNQKQPMTQGSEEKDKALDQNQPATQGPAKKEQALDQDQAAATASANKVGKSDIKHRGLPTIYTRKLSWSNYVYFWKLAEALEMPVILEILKSQMFKDLAEVGAATTASLLDLARGRNVIAPQKHFTGRLRALAKNDPTGPELTLADVDALVESPPLPDIDRVAIETYADWHYDKLSYNDEGKLKGATPALKQAVLAEWAKKHEKDQRKAQAIANRKAEARRFRNEAMYKFDEERGEVVAVAPTTLWSPHNDQW